MRFHDPRAEEIADRSMQLTDGLHDEQLSHHLCYGGMHPLEAQIKVDIMLAKASVANDYRAAMRRWQRKQGISSLEWETISYCGYSVDVATINDQLSPTKSDVQLLRSHKHKLIAFLDNVQQYFKLWQYNESAKSGQYPWRLVCWKECCTVLGQADWLVISHHDGISNVHFHTGDIADIPFNEIHVYAYPVSPTYSDDRCTWFQLNNLRPSW